MHSGLSQNRNSQKDISQNTPHYFHIGHIVATALNFRLIVLCNWISPARYLLLCDGPPMCRTIYRSFNRDNEYRVRSSDDFAMPIREIGSYFSMECCGCFQVADFYIRCIIKLSRKFIDEFYISEYSKA